MDDDEIYIGDEEDDIININERESSQEIKEEENSIERIAKLRETFNKQVNLCSKYFPYLKVTTEDSKIYFIIPANILPLSTQEVCGFTVDPILLNISITLNKNYEWTESLESSSVSHPVYGQSYYGRPLVLEVIHHFFSKSHIPKSSYRSCHYAFQPIGNADKILHQQLIREGYDVSLSQRALILNYNDIEKARNFLLTGEDPYNTIYVPISFDDSPLVFLVLEIIECFIDLSDHCCICRKSLPFAGIRPQICDKPLCNYSFNEIGVGTSVLQEIKRDPLAADFIISVFSGSFENEKYMNPAPPDDIKQYMRQTVSTLPSMRSIISQCKNDTDILKNYGQKALDFLRWVLMSNRSQVISLSGKQRIKEVPAKLQFMTLIASPEAEIEFLQRKSNHGSSFMWHGSGGERWHSILRNGLKNMSNVPGEAIHGTAYGPGIYFAKESCISMGYASAVNNAFYNSAIGHNFFVLALCEVASVKRQLKDCGQICTLQDEKACIVRFMFVVNNAFVASNQIRSVPILDDVLKEKAVKAKDANIADNDPDVVEIKTRRIRKK